MNYRCSKGGYENTNRIIFDGTGTYDVPVLQPTQLSSLPADIIGFNYAKSCKDPTDRGIHFFLDDYQFVRLWNRPNDYISLLGKFKCVCTPDFSTYTDFPRAIQIYNHYRKHWLGAYWQMHGIKVIPTISWSDEASFEWCFDGEPMGGVVVVSSVGTQVNSTAKRLFMLGYREMLDRLKPSNVLFYGFVPDGCEGAEIVPLSTFQDDLKKRAIGKNMKTQKI